MKKPNVHNNWDPLKEIWLGDVWPSHFYDDLTDHAVRDVFYQITEWTKEDLNNIQKKFESLGVTVKRPNVEGPKERHLVRGSGVEKLESGLNFLKPPITPRDCISVIGNKLYFNPMYEYECYKHLLNEFDPESIIKNVPKVPGTPTIAGPGGANLVKIGKDLIIDEFIPDFNMLKRTNPAEALRQERQHALDCYPLFDHYNKMFGNDYRLHFATQGGHCDGCFMPLRFGLLLSTGYYKDYEFLFPDWKKINILQPTYAHKYMYRPSEWRWNIPGVMAPPHFNTYIEKYCSDWVGNFTETYFEVNIIMVDEKNLICIGTNDELFNELEKEGITCHVTPFRTRTFWDGGLHCITLDTIREGGLVDYYPERGAPGIKNIYSKSFDYSTEKYMAALNQTKY
jgi:hypothetical protein